MRAKARLSDMNSSSEFQNYFLHSLSLNELEVTSDNHEAERNNNIHSSNSACNANTQLLIKLKGD